MTFKRQNEFDVRSVQQTKDGGYVLAGSMTLSPGYYPLPGIPLMDYGNSDAAVIKTDPNGNQQWEKTFGWWGEREMAGSVLQTIDGGYVIEGSKAGFSLSLGSDKNYLWLIKTDANGNEQWNRVLAESWETLDSSILQTSDRGYIFTGYTNHGADKKHDWLIKTDTNGNLQWKKVLGGVKKDRAYTIQEISDHVYVLTGFTESYGAGNNDAWLVKIRDTNASGLETTVIDINDSDEKSTAGFEILGAMVSVVILFLLMRERT